VLHVLEQLGVAPKNALPQHREPPVLGGGLPVGSLRAAGDLERA
jgi:hypothetical protein